MKLRNKKVIRVLKSLFLGFYFSFLLRSVCNFWFWKWWIRSNFYPEVLENLKSSALPACQTCEGRENRPVMFSSWLQGRWDYPGPAGGRGGARATGTSTRTWGSAPGGSTQGRRRRVGGESAGSGRESGRGSSELTWPRPGSGAPPCMRRGGRGGSRADQTGA